LFRQRQFTQDDSHVFVRPDQVIDGVRNYLEMSLTAYKELGFDKVEVSISLRPEQRFGSDSDWDQAEEGCREACRQSGLHWNEEQGGGAFYGPKIELGVRDKLGRLWQMGVVQLDYVLPKRFDISYVDESSSKASPVILHHAVLGSLERMVGTLLEAHGVNLPKQLHPYPLVLVPVSQAHVDWAMAVAKELTLHDVECLVEAANEPVPAKVRNWKIKGARSIQVIGDKEIAAYSSSAVRAGPKI
jgi:threonyl-tRNA synthetase